MTTSPRSPERPPGGRFWLAALVACTVAASSGRALAQGPADPRAVVQRVVDAASKVLLDPKLPNAEKRSRIEELVHQNVDFEVVCKLVLARNYKRFSASQLADFQKEFERHMLYTYWKNAESAHFERIDVLNDREEARGDWTVETAVISTGDETRMDYRMRREATKDGAPPGEWKIIDLVIENVSLIANFRAQFQEILSSKTPDEVIEMLRKKNAEAEEAEKKAAGDRPAGKGD